MSNLLPATSGFTALAVDTPSEGADRPFGLTQTTIVGNDRVWDLRGLTYDPVRQVTIRADKKRTTDDDQDNPGDNRPPPTSWETQYDHQYDTDYDDS
jgi:hypothetical protein